MKLNPFINAAAAASYVGAVALFIHFISSIRHNTPDTLLDSVGFISLLVCSAAVMAFLFFYQPTALLIESRKKEALAYFFKTLGTFALITIAVLAFVSLQAQ